MTARSPFLDTDPLQWTASNELAFCVRDRYPVSRGHTLVIPKRVVATWFDATREEQHALIHLVDEVKRALDAEFHPDGYNVGFNAGEAAGQTVMHLHVHVIPRFSGDMDDPRGGVRGVIPGKGNYLIDARPRAPQADPMFAEKLFSLLDEGRFTTTYKYAVLLGLMDLCTEATTAEGAAPRSVTTVQLAEKVLALYWPQATKFPLGDVLLRQSSDPKKPASLLSRIIEFRETYARDPSASLGRARTDAPDAFQKLVRDVEWTLIEMPLPRLQRVGGGGGIEDAFLYAINWSLNEPVAKRAFNADDFDNSIRFQRGAAEQLAALATVLRPVVQGRWSAKIAQLNGGVIQDAQLEQFLFGANRISLTPVRDPLVELHNGRCFYCDGRLNDATQIDHFIAWARHPDNSLDNLVPAHAKCNEAKSDHIAATSHLEHWFARSRAQNDQLNDVARQARWERNADRTLGIGRGLYLRLRDGIRLWVARDEFENVETRDVRRVFGG